MGKVSNNEPLISIIVPVYKVEKYLNKCVKSIINQTYSNLEIILVDDGSPDNCGKMCDDYAKKDKRIKVIHKKNGGLSDARNKGIEIATGDYIGFVDSDDWINPDMYKILYELLIKYNADISCCNLVRTVEDIKIEEKKIEVKTFSKEEYLKKYFKINSQDCVYYAWNKLYKKSIIDKEQYPVGLTSEDVVGTYKALLKTEKIVETNRVLYYYRYNPNSITGKFSDKDFDLLKIWDEVVKLSEKCSKENLDYAILNRKRINFTLLTRIAFNFSISEIKKMDVVKKLLFELKKDEKYLLKAPIVKGRKILIFFFCRNYYLTARFLRFVKGR